MAYPDQIGWFDFLRSGVTATPPNATTPHNEGVSQNEENWAAADVPEMPPPAAPDPQQPVQSSYAGRLFAARPETLPPHAKPGELKVYINSNIGLLKQISALRNAFEDGDLSAEGLDGAKLMLEETLGRPLTPSEWPEVEGSESARFAIMDAFRLAERVVRGRIINAALYLVPTNDNIVGSSTPRTITFRGRTVNFCRELNELSRIDNTFVFLARLKNTIEIADATIIAAGLDRAIEYIGILQDNADSLQGNILDNITVANGLGEGTELAVSANSERADYHDYDASKIRRHLSEMRDKLRLAKEMLAAGKSNEARDILLIIANSKMVAKISDAMQGQDIATAGAKFRGAVIIVALSMGLAEIVTASVSPILIDTFGADTIAGGFVELLIQATVFTTSNGILSAALLQEPLWNNLGDYGKEILYTAAMFKVIGSAMKVYQESVAKILYTVAARRLIARGVIKAEEIWTKAAQELIVKEAAQGPLGKILVASGGFTFEVGSFQSWEFVKQSIERNPNADAVFAFASIAEGAKFILALKIGGFVARPITMPSREAAQRRVMAKFGERLAALQHETNIVLSELENAAELCGNTTSDRMLDKVEGLLAKKIALMKEMYRSRLISPEEIALAEVALGELRRSRRSIEAEENRMPDGLEPQYAYAGAYTGEGVRTPSDAVRSRNTSMMQDGALSRSSDSTAPALEIKTAEDASVIEEMVRGSDSREVDIVVAKGIGIRTAIEALPQEPCDKTITIFDHEGRKVFERRDEAGKTYEILHINGPENIADILSAPLPSGSDRTVIIDMDGFREADLKHLYGQINMNRNKISHVDVRTSRAGDYFTTIKEIFKRCPDLGTISVTAAGKQRVYTRAFFDLEPRPAPVVSSAKSTEPPPPPLPLVIEAEMVKTMKTSGWNERNLNDAGRFSDAMLVRQAQDPISLQRLASRASEDGTPSPAAVKVQQLMKIFSDTKAPKVAWLWLRALAAKACETGREDIFDSIVEKTIALHSKAQSNGKRLSGAVIETVATTHIEALEWIGYADIGESGGKAGKVQGSRGELAILNALLEPGSPARAVHVIPRSGTGTTSTPDFVVYYGTSQEATYREVWDVKTKTGEHDTIDAQQFTRSGIDRNGIRRYRIILLGGNKAENIPGTVSLPSHPDIIVHHIPSANPQPEDVLSVIKI